MPASWEEDGRIRRVVREDDWPMPSVVRRRVAPRCVPASAALWRLAAERNRSVRRAARSGFLSATTRSPVKRPCETMKGSRRPSHGADAN
jgi:hypothetical protein